jgi:hypothetical protein
VTGCATATRPPDDVVPPPGARAVASARRDRVCAGMAVTVVCDDGGPGRVAVVAGPVRVLIDTCGGDPGTVTLAPAGGPVLAGGARVYPLAARRAR